MYTVALLATLLAGQCGPRGCPSRSTGGLSQLPPIFPSYTPQPAIRVIDCPVQQSPQRVYNDDWHYIEDKGLKFYVWGEKQPNGRILWDRNATFNKTQFDKAVAASMAKAKQDAVLEIPKRIAEAAPKNFGLAPERMGKTGYSGDVHEYESRAEKNDKMFLTVIGNKEDRRAVVEDWNRNPEYNGVRDRVNFGEFDRNSWQVADNLGYAGNGKPTILVQEPSGRVYYRAYDYSGGARSVVQALRRADPNYRPENDPGPNSGLPGPEFTSYSVIGLCVVVLLAYLLIPRRDT